MPDNCWPIPISANDPVFMGKSFIIKNCFYWPDNYWPILIHANDTVFVHKQRNILSLFV